MTLSEVNKDNAVEFIQKHHYSPVMPKLTKHFLGFSDRLHGKLVLLFAVVVLA